MSFYNGILNLTNWVGNVIIPTLGGLFIAFAVIQFARGYHHLYSTWAYGGLMCLMVSGLLRMFEKFTGQAGWNNPDLYWNSLLNLVDWFANVVLPVYAGLHVTVGALKLGGFPQRPDGVLAVKASYFNELVKNLLLFDSRSGLIPIRYRFDQFSSGCQTQLPPDSVPLQVEPEWVTFS